MSVNGAKAVIARFLDEVWNQGNMDAIDEMCADGFCHYDSVGRDTHDLASFKQYVAATYAGFPDLRLIIEEQKGTGSQSTGSSAGRIVASAWASRRPAGRSSWKG
jgi:hypothetical protein